MPKKRVPGSEGPDVLQHIADQVGVTLQRHGLLADAAHSIGAEVAESVRQTFAGELLYMPKGRFQMVEKKYRELWAAFNGTNVKELAHRFDMTEQHVYRVIKLMSRDQTARHQGALFAGGESSVAQASKRGSSGVSAA
jgi:Mor family transcriptional regulator